MKALLNNRVFALYTFLLVCLHPIALSAQCPSFTNSTFSATCLGAGTPCILCSNQTITLGATGTNLPNAGCVKWYYSHSSGFNPYNGEGTYIGCGSITGSLISNVSFSTVDAMCNNGAYFIVGIIDPLDLTNCPQTFTTEFSFQVDCPIATISASDTTQCGNYPLYFYSSGGVSYHWSGPSGPPFNPNIQNPWIAIPNVVNQGTFTVTVTDALGCTAVKSIYIEVYPPIYVNIPTNPDVVYFCEGGYASVTATIIGGGSGSWDILGWYTWGDLNNKLDSFITKDFTLITNQPDAYGFWVQDLVTGCIYGATKVVSKLPAIHANINPDPLQVCLGGSVTATVSCNDGVPPYTYLWTTGENTASIQIHDIGIYKATVTDKNGCTAVDSITVTPGAPPDVSIDAPSLFFCPGGSKAITGQASGGKAPYTFNWTTPGGAASGQTVNANMTGSYIVTVTDKIGCTDTASVFMMKNPDIMLDINPNPAIFCLGSSVQLTATASGGSGSNYQYLWTTPTGSVTGAVVTAIVAGNYSVTVTDGEGCKKSASIVVQVVKITVDINPNPAEFCPGGSIDLNTQVSGGNGNYTYHWESPGGNSYNTANINANEFGTYNVTITDGNGCTGKASSVVNQKAPIVINLKADPPIICNGGTVQLTVTATGGSGNNYTYDWTTPSGTDTGPAISTTQAGTFTVTVTDGGFCISSASIEVKVSELEVDINPKPAIICNNGAIQLVATAKGGTGMGYQYNWTTPTGPATGSKITATIAGNYLVTVSDSGGCFKEASIEVTATTSLLVNIIPDPAGFCTGSSVDLTTYTIGGSGVYTYQWTIPGGNSTKDTIKTAVKGLYNITVTDSNGCSGTASTTVNENPNPDISISPVPAGFCPGASIQLSVSSTDPSINTYNWITPAGTQTNDKINAGVEGNYYVTISNKNGCTAIDSIYVKQFPGVDVSINPDPANFCMGSSVQLSATSSTTGIINYSWSTPTGAKTGNMLIASVAGIYIVTASNSDGCIASDTVIVTQISSIPVNIDPSNPGFCTGSNINLSANATGSNLSYSWNTPIGNLNGPIININTSGNYTVTVTDGGGCSGTASINVKEYPVLDILIDPNPASFCNTGSAILTAINNNGTAPFSYNWSTPIGYGNNPTFSANTAGIYLVTVTDVHGCSGTASSQVTQSNSLTINFMPITPGFCPGKTVDLTASANGGQAPYTYNWNTPIGYSSQTIITSGIAGTYQLTITDANGCSGIGTIELKELSSPSITLPATYGFCKGSQVSIKAIATDILTPLSFYWSTPTGSSVLDSLTATVAGNYNVTVTNSQGCISTATITVEEWPLPVIQFSPDPVQICKGSSVDLNAITSVGLSPYKYNWQGPSGSLTTNPINITLIGNYTVTITDAHGCSSNASVTASESPGLNVTLTTDPKILCEINQYNIISQTTGGNIPYSYNWITPSGTQNTASINAIDFGIFTLTVTDTKGCTGSSTITTKDESLTIELDKTDPGCIALKSGSITLLSALNAGYPLQLKLNNNPPVNITSLPYILEPLTAGNYQLIITAPNGCQKTFDLDLSTPSTPSLALGEDVTIYLGESYTIIPIANFAIDSISWTNKSSLLCSPGCVEPIATPQYSTHYKATAYSKDGCKATDDINIIVVEKESVFVPNSFSPNGDGINDKWVIFTDKTVKKIKTMYIYDRWGESIFIEENFPPNDLNYGWDGKFRNQLMNDGVFVYYFVVEFNDGRTKVYKGDVNLLR